MESYRSSGMVWKDEVGETTQVSVIRDSSAIRIRSSDPYYTANLAFLMMSSSETLGLCFVILRVLCAFCNLDVVSYPSRGSSFILHKILIR